MRSLQEYVDLYRGIGRRLNLQGDSIEMLAQMLANATYISEVEHISYTQESSIERASHINSKIQHCMNEMYSVFRGSCPRVIMKLTSSTYFDLKVYDEIATLNNFNVYYLGYYDPANNLKGGESPQFTYSSVVIPSNKEIILIALISPKCLLGEWKISTNNQYYVNFLETNLSNDIQVLVNNEITPSTRIFSDHIKTGAIFDLTLPDYGLRLYAPDVFRKDDQNLEEISIIPTDTSISLKAFRFSELSSYNVSELKSVKVKGAKLISFEGDSSWNYYGTELSTGLIFINEVPRDTLESIHYKTIRDKYVGSIFRSNSDIGHLLEEMYSEKIYPGGTSYKFEELIKNPSKTINFGFTPSDFIDGSTNDNFRYLEGKEDKNLTLETDLIDANTDNTYPLTVYSSKTNPVSIYFNNNPNVVYQSEENPQILFKGSKIRLDSPGAFVNNKIFGGVIKVPISGSGVLRIYHKSSYDLSTKSVYDINTSLSIIKRTETNVTTPVILVDKILKTTDGIIDIIDFNSDYYFYVVEYRYYNSSNIEIDRRKNESNRIILDSKFIINNSVFEIGIQLYRYTIDPEERERLNNSTIGGINELDYSEVVDEEIIPIVFTKENLEEEKETGDEEKEPNLFDTFTISLSNDVIFLESDKEGNIKPFASDRIVKVNTYLNGKYLTEGVQFSTVCSSGIICSITETGELSVNLDSELEKPLKKDGTIIVEANYNGERVTSSLTLKTVITEKALQKRKLVISDDSTGKTTLMSIDSELFGMLSEYRYLNLKEAEALYLWLEGVSAIDIYSIEWIQDEEIDISNPLNVYPRLNIYYIPQSPSSLLTDEEVEEYINKRGSYFVTQEIKIQEGTVINALITLNVELFKDSSIDEDVKKILSEYSNSFNIDLEQKKSDLYSSLGKISEVKRVNSINITYSTELGDEVPQSEYSSIDLNHSYFNINYQINSVIAK